MRLHIGDEITTVEQLETMPLGTIVKLECKTTGNTEAGMKRLNMVETFTTFYETNTRGTISSYKSLLNHYKITVIDLPNRLNREISALEEILGYEYLTEVEASWVGNELKGETIKKISINEDYPTGAQRIVITCDSGKKLFLKPAAYLDRGCFWAEITLIDAIGHEITHYITETEEGYWYPFKLHLYSGNTHIATISSHENHLEEKPEESYSFNLVVYDPRKPQ